MISPSRRTQIIRCRLSSITGGWRRQCAFGRTPESGKRDCCVSNTDWRSKNVPKGRYATPRRRKVTAAPTLRVGAGDQRRRAAAATFVHPQLIGSLHTKKPYWGPVFRQSNFKCRVASEYWRIVRRPIHKISGRKELIGHTLKTVPV